MSAPQIIWFRNDLRLADHAAVRAAAAAGPVIALFVLDDDTPEDHRIGAAQRWWLHHSLAALTAELERRGGALLLRRGRAGVVVPQVAAEAGAEAVHVLRRTEPWCITQVEAVAAATHLVLHDGSYLAPPETVRAGGGGRYRIFTPFWRKLQLDMPPAPPITAPARMTFAPPLAGDALADWGLLPVRPDWSGGFDVWTPGEDGAAAQLAHFCGHARDYDTARNLPSQDGSSRLSPYLATGEISVGTVWHAVADAAGNAAEPFLRELAWRDFAHGLIDQFPDYGWKSSRERFDRLAFRDDAAGLKAWRTGTTGYPIVDAGMRQLWATGWMHNRVRMIAASFLTKHLLIDWRAGERWFWDCLVDADYGNNALGWQWVMGSGVDSSPFNRIFAPVPQSAKFDAAGYIRQWVPELARLADADIHAPWEAGPMVLKAAGVTLGRTYPQPVVDHAAARALAAYAAVKD